MTSTELITDIANVALTLSFIVAVVFGIAQVQVARRDRKERITMEAMRYFQTREFAELMHHVNTYQVPASMEEWRSRPAADQVVYLQFTQSMESLGILVAERYVNLELVDKTLGVFVISAWEKFRELSYDIRKNLPDPFLNEYFQWLAEHLDARMTQKPRRPFHEQGRQTRRKPADLPGVEAIS